MACLKVIACAVGLTVSAPGPAQVSTAPSVLADASGEFYLYTLPLLEVARRRDEHIARFGANRFNHSRALADDTFREVTTPNNDTIYSNAFIDLRNGPVTIAIPATGRRYFSLALMDAYSNNFAYFGTRATAGQARTVTLIGPTSQAKEGGNVVRAPTPWVWALGRTLVTGPEDLNAARAVQDKLVITGSAVGQPPEKVPPSDAAAGTLVAAAVRLIAENPPPRRDEPTIARFRSAGLLDGTTKVTAIDVARGFDAARVASRAARRPGEVKNGWIYPKSNLGNFGTDYSYRAAVALTGLAAMGSEEAMYMRSAAPTSTGLFDGNRSYRLHFDKGLEPPVDAFWSLSMYERTADGGFYFVANPVRRYAIGDRTPELTRNADGSLDIWISHADPGQARRNNWLPAPAGPFALSLRAYLPRTALRDGSWRAPAVELLN